MNYKYVIRASYGNDSCALIQYAHEAALQDVAVLYSDTGWAADGWIARVDKMEKWVISLGFAPHRTASIGLEDLVRARKGWPRQGIQFCTQELKIIPSLRWHDQHDPTHKAIVLIGKRREESHNRQDEPEWIYPDGTANSVANVTWQPLVTFNEASRNELLNRAGIEPLPHRSQECYPCINSNRADLRSLVNDESRIAHIERIERELGNTSKGNPRTMFRPYRYMGATGIREIIRWAQAERGEYESLDDGTGGGCDSGLCGR